VSPSPSAPADSWDEGTELRSILGSARELLVECVEEGIDEYEEQVAAPEPPAHRATEQTPLSPTNPTQARPQPAKDSSVSAPPWPDHPTLELVREHLGDCTRCELSGGRKNIVFGSGNANADLMFIGEGPGQQEDREGIPFVGRAGELLTQMIENGLEIPRSSVYICNIVKCRPPNNRTPLPNEVATCKPFLDGQIDAIAPKVIVALGKPATSLLLGRDIAITRMRGTWQEYRGIAVMPTFHPAFVLRQYTPENRRLVWQDLKAALERSGS
jgi:uracil-DNA glycosylase family 4